MDTPYELVEELLEVWRAEADHRASEERSQGGARQPAVPGSHEALMAEARAQGFLGGDPQ